MSLQRTHTWYKDREGKLTGSRINEIIRKGRKGQPSKMRQTYCGFLACQRVGLPVKEAPLVPDIRRGIKLEAEGLKKYAKLIGQEIELRGFINHPTIPMAGFSPDAVVGRTVVELKCPRLENHIDIAMGGMPEKYKPQVQWAMCHGYDCVDFCSYCPDAGEELELVVFQVYPDKSYQAFLEEEAQSFLREVTELSLKLVIEMDC